MTIGDLMDKREEIGYARGEQIGYQNGAQAGRLETFANLLQDLGEPPAEILEQVKTLDNDTLKIWTKLAAKADSMEEFLTQIG